MTDQNTEDDRLLAATSLVKKGSISAMFFNRALNQSIVTCCQSLVVISSFEDFILQLLKHILAALRLWKTPCNPQE